MQSWKGMEPKSVCVIVHRAEGLVSERKSEKGARYVVTFGTGKKKQCVSEPMESPQGCPVFQSEAKVKITDLNDPVVLLVSDKKYNCGQVLIPVHEIHALPEGTKNPHTAVPKRWSELEQTKKQSNPRGYLEYTCWVDELRPAGLAKEKVSGGLKGLLSRSKLDIRSRSGSRPSIADMSVSTPHLLGVNGSFSSGKSGKMKKGSSPMMKFKFRGRKTSRASSRSDIDSIADFGGTNSIFDDGVSSASGISLEEPLPPPVPPHGKAPVRYNRRNPSDDFGSSFSSQQTSDPFAGRNPFESEPVRSTNPFDEPSTDYRGHNPFDEEDTTDLDALTSENPPSASPGRRKICPSVSRQGSSSGSEYSLDGGSPSVPQVTVGRAQESGTAGVSVEAVAAAVAQEKPVILSVSPMEATLEPGTVIHLEGRFMAKGASDIESVYLGDCELKGDRIQYVTSSKIKVFTRRWYSHRGPVFIKTYSNGNVYFDEDKEFVFYDPARKESRKPSVRTSSFTSGYRSHSREPSTMSESESVNSNGKRYRKASRCHSNTSRSMFHLPSAGDDLSSVQPKIKANGSKSPGGSWSKGTTSLASRLTKSITDLTQPLFHKKKASLGSQADLSEAFNDNGDSSPSKSRSNSTKKKASACAARIERKNDLPNGQMTSAMSVPALEEENRRLQSELDNLKRKVSELELSNKSLISLKKERDDYIDRLQAKMLEANLFDFFNIDNGKDGKSLVSTT